MTQMKNKFHTSLFAAAGLLALSLSPGTAIAEEKATVIPITQVACQFIESENGKDHAYSSKNAKECQAFNRKTGAKRVQASETLKLKPGKYIFRVTNRDVPWAVGFWVREKGFQLGNKLHKATKISVAGGKLKEGQTQDYEVTLKPGEYHYSCPLNPTPDYNLIVSN